MEGKKTIMVVEDNPLNMKLASDLLKIGGFDVLEAADGKIALKILEQKIPDLILLDLQLPDMDGFEVMRRIKSNERTKSIRVVVMTASVMREDEKNIQSAGFDGYIPKPINTREFIKQVDSVL